MDGLRFIPRLAISWCISVQSIYIYIYKASKNRVETVYKNIPILFLLSCSFTTSHPLHQGSHFLRQTQGLAEPTAANYPPSSPLWPPRWWGKDLASDNSTGAKTRDKRFLSGRWGGGFAVVRRDNNPPPRFSRVNSGNTTRSRLRIPNEISKASKTCNVASSR